MGIYDRDYYRPRQPGLTLRGPSTVIGWLVLINVAMYLANGLLTPQKSAHADLITDTLALQAGALIRPWLWWQFVTYGFAHAPWPDVRHIACNMLSLWFLGRDIEDLYGRKEFVRLYLAMIVFAGVAWCVYEMVMAALGDTGIRAALEHTGVGASGAISGIVLLYALHFPRRTLLLMFVIPVPAWVAGVLLIVFESLGALDPNASNIAHAAHLGGAAFAFAYYRFGWRITPLTDRLLPRHWLKRRPRLRLHRPDRPRQDDRDDSEAMGDEVDRILAKIHRDGVDSLTSKERRTLETASHRYQRRRKE